MILDEELARDFRAKVVQAIFGEDWKPERPLDNLGGEILPLTQGKAVKDFGDYQHRSGRIQGMIAALTIFNDAAKEASGT